MTDTTAVSERIGKLDWSALAAGRDARGNAVVEGLLERAECEALAALYPFREAFRNCVVMERQGYGQGEYKYFAYPLSGLVAELRIALYSHLVPIANRWSEVMGLAPSYPDEPVPVGRAPGRTLRDLSSHLSTVWWPDANHHLHDR
jgi:uncharacterized protein